MLENEEKIPLQLFNFEIDSDASMQLKKGAGWAKFFGIIGLILSTIFVFSEMASLYAYIRIDSIGGSFRANNLHSFTYYLTMLFSIIATIAFLISCVYLLQYSGQLSKSIENEDSNLLAQAFKKLKTTLILWSFTIGSFLLVGIFIVFIRLN